MITKFSLKIELDGLTEARDCHRFIDQIIVYGGERPHFIAYRGEKDKKNTGRECQHSRHSSDHPLCMCFCATNMLLILHA